MSYVQLFEYLCSLLAAQCPGAAVAFNDCRSAALGTCPAKHLRPALRQIRRCRSAAQPGVTRYSDHTVPTVTRTRTPGPPGPLSNLKDPGPFRSSEYGRESHPQSKSTKVQIIQRPAGAGHG
eukprot:344899-Hanusia_phi.AAC.2